MKYEYDYIIEKFTKSGSIISVISEKKYDDPESAYVDGIAAAKRLCVNLGRIVLYRNAEIYFHSMIDTGARI